MFGAFVAKVVTVLGPQPPEEHTPLDRTVSMLAEIGLRGATAVPRPGAAPRIQPAVPANTAPAPARMTA